MYGIVAYNGWRDAQDYLLEGLQRLEYRGYDSVRLYTLHENQFLLQKSAGRLQNLTERLTRGPLVGTLGIAHTRWATHGAATDANAHPHFGGHRAVALAHNGVLENFRPLKDRLEAEDFTFRSKTDTEGFAHLIASCLERQQMLAAPTDPPHITLLAAMRSALSQLRGTYGLVMMFRDHPGLLLAAKLGSPLVIGIDKGEHFVASDASPLVGYTDKIVYLSDHQVAIITPETLRITHHEQGRVAHQVQPLLTEMGVVKFGIHAHYKLKEIHEQPDSLLNAMRGRLDDDHATAKFGGLNLTPQQLREVDRIILTACGSSWHAALLGEYLIESLARIPVEVEYASELRYRHPPIGPGTLVFAISQSGETADTLAALREMQRMGHRTLAICNVIGSSIAQEADGRIYLHAGPEIGVASTKAFTSQCLVLAMLGLFFGRTRHLSYEAGETFIAGLRTLPEQIEAVLQVRDQIGAIVQRFWNCANFLYLGRQFNFPIALEGALKLKEISYIHAEGYPAAEMKHGPIALVDANTPSIFLVPQGFVRNKVLGNLQEIAARGGPIIAIAEGSDEGLTQLTDDIIVVPSVDPHLQPLVHTVPLQLLA